MQTVTLNVADEMKSAGDALQALIGDIIAKKTVAEIIADSLPGLMAAVASYASMASDIVLADNEAYLVRAIKLGINGK